VLCTATFTLEHNRPGWNTTTLNRTFMSALSYATAPELRNRFDQWSMGFIESQLIVFSRKTKQYLQPTQMYSKQYSVLPVTVVQVYLAKVCCMWNSNQPSIHFQYLLLATVKFATFNTLVQATQTVCTRLVAYDILLALIFCNPQFVLSIELLFLLGKSEL
jgi:hypothetical protein